MNALREKLARWLAPWLYRPHQEQRDEAFKMLALVAYGSRDAVWTSPTTLARVAMDQKWADGFSARGREIEEIEVYMREWRGK